MLGLASWRGSIVARVVVMKATPSARVLPVSPYDGVRRCVLSGEITSSGALCDVISFLANAAWWGELVVESEGITRSLYFDERHVVAAQSNASAERLGTVLVRCGTLSEEEAQACAERAIDRNLRFGEALVELGFVQREQLFSLMGKQVKDIFGGLAALERGQFSFFAGFADAALSFRHKHSVDALLLDVMSNREEASQLTREQYVSTVPSVAKPPRLETRKTIEVYNHAIVDLLVELDEMGVGDQVRQELADFAGAEGSGSFWPAGRRAEDGGLAVDEMVARVECSSDPATAEERLARWCYDYASYAVFLAQPHFERRDAMAIASSKLVHHRFESGNAAGPVPVHSTVRMRRVSAAHVPGLDPSRTARIHQVDVAALGRAQEQARVAQVVVPRTEPKAARKGMGTATVAVIAGACMLFGGVVALGVAHAGERHVAPQPVMGAP